jgi:hypothetical protein
MKTHSGCGEDTCMPWYRFSHTMSLDYQVDTESVMQQDVIDAFTVALDDWHAAISERCTSAMPSVCDKQTFVTFTRGDAKVGLAFLSWRGGQFHVDIDARSQ